MTTPMPADTGGSRDRRVLLGVLLVVLLLLASSCGAFGLGRRSADSGPVGEPAPSGSPLPAPTVTVTASPSPTLPSTGGQTPDPAPTGGGTGGGNGAAGDGSGSGTGSIEGDSALKFTLAAAVGGPVVIGVPRDLTVTVSNPNSAPLDLSTVLAAPRTPSLPGCLASWVSVGDYVATRDGALRVPARGSRNVTLTFELLNLPSINQNACQGASFPLSLTGTGRLG